MTKQGAEESSESKDETSAVAQQSFTPVVADSDMESEACKHSDKISEKPGSARQHHMRAAHKDISTHAAKALAESSPDGAHECQIFSHEVFGYEDSPALNAAREVCAVPYPACPFDGFLRENLCP